MVSYWKFMNNKSKIPLWEGRVKWNFLRTTSQYWCTLVKWRGSGPVFWWFKAHVQSVLSARTMRCRNVTPVPLHNGSRNGASHLEGGVANSTFWKVNLVGSHFRGSTTLFPRQSITTADDCVQSVLSNSYRFADATVY